MSSTQEKVAVETIKENTVSEEAKTTQQEQQQQQGENTQNQEGAPEVQQPKKNKYLKCNYKYCKHYEDINQIVKSFPHLASLQQPLEVESIPNALCYVIRSNNDDDVHKAIKYGIWTSVPGNNIKLNNAYEQSVELGVDVYLFFSVVKSGQFIGVAKLKSSFQEETFSYWWQPHKFKGHFRIEWVFVKDVKQKAFEGLKNSQNDDISRSKDCTELKFETTGKQMLQIYKDSQSSTSIFQDFVYLDQKEQVIRNTYSYFGRQNNKNNGGYHNQRNNNQNNALYQNLFMNPQLMTQNGIYPQYTPEQINQISQMCFTNIYPPNSYPQYQSPFMMGGNNQSHGKNYHHNNNKRNFNNKKNYQNKDKNNSQNQNQQQTQQKSEEQTV